ncbi:MAG: TMEM175 family protein [Planctomycetota bacterium]
MEVNRLEAFSDGVLAIIITIMVLELKVPAGGDLAGLRPLLPVFLAYVLSFVYLGIYWNNHHHLLKVARRASAATMWANLHLLFWLSLLPFVTGWAGANRFAPVPNALYGVVLLLAAVAYFVLQTTVVAQHGRDSALAAALGRDLKGKLSVALYAVAVAACAWQGWVAVAIYVLVALWWLVPDRRIERALAAECAAAPAE